MLKGFYDLIYYKVLQPTITLQTGIDFIALHGKWLQLTKKMYKSVKMYSTHMFMLAPDFWCISVQSRRADLSLPTLADIKPRIPSLYFL